MVLSDEKLLELITAGYIPSDVHLGPCSVDLTLGSDYLIPYLPKTDLISRSPRTTPTVWPQWRPPSSTLGSSCWQQRMR